MANILDTIPMPVEAKPQSLVLRSVIAILLTILFYGLALAIAGGLLFAIYAEVVYLERIDIRLTLMMLIAAGTILWAIAPRIEQFTPPGPRLLPDQQPELFKVIHSVAEKLNQKIPGEVYLVSDFNAGVLEVGGFMGVGSKRVMVIGLPLLQMLTIQQFKAVIAHEFGHFYGGDTTLAPWIYQTRKALIRTVMSLGSKSLVQIPFRWFAEMFIRVTEAISRRQEFVADALATFVAGKQPNLEVLRLLPGMSMAYSAYWETEILPVLNSGYLPPLANGFSQFTQTESIKNAVEAVLNKELSTPETSPYDSHPAVRDRMNAVEKMSQAPGDVNNQPAISLIANLPGLEKRMVAVMFNKQAVLELKAIRWEQVGTCVYIERWEKIVDQYKDGLVDMKLPDIPQFRSLSGPFAKIVLRSIKQDTNQEQLRKAVDYILQGGMAVILARAGWTAQALPGSGVTMVKNDLTVEPFSVLKNLEENVLSPDKWTAECERMGIAGLGFDQNRLDEESESAPVDDEIPAN